MNETQAIDMVFSYFFNARTSFLPDDLASIKVSKNHEDAVRHCDRLASLYFLDKKPSENTYNKPYRYQISSIGIHFIDSLSDGYREKPYTYYLELENTKEEKRIEGEELDNKVKELTIGNANTQKWISLFSLIVAALSIISAFVISLGTTKTDTQLQSMQQLLDNQQKTYKMLQQISLDLQQLDSAIVSKKK